MINLNDLATRITKQEGGAVSLSIGQVKEVIHLTLEELASRDIDEVILLMKRYRKED